MTVLTQADRARRGDQPSHALPELLGMRRPQVDLVDDGVFLADASDRGRALIDRELYLPKAWTEDRSRCRAAGIGDDVDFATKPELAQAMIERALDAGVPFGWVTGDEACGQVGRLRLWLESRGVTHVLAVPKSQMVIGVELRQRRAHAVIADLPVTAWQRHSCGDGAHGPKLSDWAVVDIRPLRERRRGHWPLARRSIADPDEIAYYIRFGPADTELAELVRVAGSRWAIEECFQTTKNETGVDHYQVRSYTDWYRHITLSMAAAAFLTILRRSKRGSETSITQLIPLMINEIRRLFNRVACPVQHTLVHVRHWSNWRRASQARARASHYKHRHHKLSLQ